MLRRNRGFTLVELLIVIVIIGILAGSLLLVFGRASDRSTATRIVSNLMTMKRASVIFFYDNGRWPENLEADYVDLREYMDRNQLSVGWASELSTVETYGIQVLNSTDVYAAVAVGDSQGMNQGIRDILEKIGISYNLTKMDGNPYTNDSDVVMVPISQIF